MTKKVASGLASLMSVTDRFRSNWSCAASTNRRGTETDRSSSRTSHLSTARSRWDSTPGATVETVVATIRTNSSGADLPTRYLRIATSGALKAKRAEPRERRIRLGRPSIGGDTNPAQMTTAFRFFGRLAAMLTAKGDENDSAKIANGSDLGSTDCTRARI